ncbi:MAG: single-stranded DNA-binding protein [Acidobacteria bacterium]|jgi:single-strand DNA-binding protein|nr:single-stranded DNA-binding protein [Acidobacteriota bacterium]MCH8128311.1 single-stranded DNA-binding protein [Acidobacteriota bacterium]
MSNTNSVTLIGNLVDDPELRFTPSGVAMTKIRFAVNKRYQNRDGEWQEETSFFGGTCWRDMAENVAESLQKGLRVIVVGELQQRSWETQEGEKRSVVEVDIKEIGPSVRWATTTVTKTPRDGAWADQSDEKVAAAAPVAKTDYGPDEAPF